MERVYITCMLIGFLLLILSAAGEVLEHITGAFEFIVHGDADFDFAFLPISGVSICAGLITFGGIGLLLHIPLLAALCGYLAAVAVQTVIRKLKKVKNESMERDELFLCDGIIINTVLPDGLGTVEFNNIKGSSTTFACRGVNRQEKLKQNTLVKLTAFDGEIAIVEKKDEFAEYNGDS